LFSGERDPSGSERSTHILAYRQFSIAFTSYACSIFVTRNALALFGVTQRVPDAARFACGSMVRFDHTFVVFALYERKNDKQEKGRSAVLKSQHTNCISPKVVEATTLLTLRKTSV
jgi:hypothetical protein